MQRSPSPPFGLVEPPTIDRTDRDEPERTNGIDVPRRDGNRDIGRRRSATLVVIVPHRLDQHTECESSFVNSPSRDNDPHGKVSSLRRLHRSTEETPIRFSLDRSRQRMSSSRRSICTSTSRAITHFPHVDRKIDEKPE